MNPERQPAAIILAAGASSRMGRPKALLEFNGETFLDRMIALFGGLCSPVIVVLGYGAPQVHAGLMRTAEADFAVNLQPERGMLSSLQTGLGRVPPGVPAVLFTPADLPCVARATIETLASVDAPLAIPVFDGRKGHPVRISREIAAEISALPHGRQARDVIHRHEAKLVQVEDSGILLDVDTPRDYEALIAGTRS